MAGPADDWNLLFGTLAVELGAVAPEALIAAQRAWVETPERPLSLILIERGALAPLDHARIEAAVQDRLHRRTVAEADAESDTEVDPEAADFALGEPPRDGDPVSFGTTAIDPDGATGIASAATDETTILASAANEVGDRRAERPPAPSGPRFRAVRPHARGGLGEVYVAWDGELERYVALKEIRREYARREDLRSRFVREAEINGNLEHPGVVPVYGRGTHNDGRPYYAMRFVRGESLETAIKRFHDRPADHRRASRWSLELRQLLGHFLDVCDSIGYAHSRGVIHRDIKPANVLLGDYGETLIIDWGLAKVVGRDDEPSPVAPGPSEAIQRLADETGPTSTVAGETLGSPPYMSPEQAAGRNDEVGPASDVYSLGATLYTLLAGVPPVSGKTRKEIIARAANGEITPPRAANPSVPPALAAVCLKALAFHPADRYESARALADDVKRWLADEPVSVHADHLGTRLLRWSRRHRPLVAAGLAVLAVGAVGLAIAAGVVNEQRRRAVVARDQAIAARQLARDHLRIGLHVVDQLVTLGDRQLIAQQGPSDRNRFLETAVSFIRRFREREPDDVSTRFPTAELARRLANLYRLAGRFAEADPLYDEAIALIEELRRLQPNDPKPVELLAGILIDRGESLLMRGRAVEAEVEFTSAGELARELVALDSAVDDYRRALARGLHHLAATLLARGRSDAAEPAEEAIALLRPLADPTLPAVSRRLNVGDVRPLIDQLDLVVALDRHAEALEAAGRIDEAEAELRGALERMDRLVAQFPAGNVPDIAYYHPWVATRLARLRLDHHGGDGARDLLDPAVEALEGVVQRYGEIWSYRTALADARLARAPAHQQAGRLDDASADAEAARALLERLNAEFPSVPDHASLLGQAREVLARVALQADPPRNQEAEALLRQAITLQQSALEVNPEAPTYQGRLASHRAALVEAGLSEP